MSCWNSFYWHLSQFSTVSFHNHFKLYSQTKLFIYCTVEAVDLYKKNAQIKKQHIQTVAFGNSLTISHKTFFYISHHLFQI